MAIDGQSGSDPWIQRGKDRHCEALSVVSGHRSGITQCYRASSTMQFYPLAIITKNQVPLRHTPGSPILHHYLPKAPMYLSNDRKKINFVPDETE